MNTGTIACICVSESKGGPKHPVPKAELRAGHGVVGDAHAGDWHRQVSLLDEADIDRMRAKGLELEPGAFGENIVTQGLSLDALGIGSRLTIGDAELEISQIGKICHQRCAIFYRAGDCIMPRLGVFAVVLRGGEVRPGAEIRVTTHIARETIQAAVLTVSDTRSRGRREDTSGPAVAEVLQARLSARVAARDLVPDEPDPIKARLNDYADRGYDLVLTVGGTGFGPRDVTPEATRDVIEREAPGLAEAMRAVSRQTTPHAMLQRGVCGIRGKTLILNLPGGERGAVENLSAVLPALPHAIALLRGENGH